MNDHGFLIWLYFPMERDTEREENVMGQSKGIVKGSRG